ncbi:MAG: hypothetical protein Q8M08_03525 [Bacteroidales bacterium]|nr:hypothetical protein [Bacteroidales bacterium]
MNFFSKNKIIFWLLIFLVVVNLSILVTFLVFYSKGILPMSNQLPDKPGFALSKALSLTPVQSDQVEVLLTGHKTLSAPLRDSIREYRTLLLEELADKDPDTNLITNYIERIGKFQRVMQKASVAQYMALKEICTADQCQNLSSLYYELFGYEGPGKGMGKGNGKGKMHRYRRGQGH